MSRFVPRHHGLAIAAIATIASLCLEDTSSAQDAYYELSFDQLEILDCTISTEPISHESARLRWQDAMGTRVVLEGRGEAYCGDFFGVPQELRSGFNTSGGPNATGGLNTTSGQPGPNPEAMYVRAPLGQEVRGWVVVPRRDLLVMDRHQFRVAPDRQDPKLRDRFLMTKQRHYQRLLDRGVAGAGWFRMQLARARAELLGLPIEEAIQRPNGRPGRAFTMQETMDLLNGGRALSENLQLNSVLSTSPGVGPGVPISTLTGVTIQEIDWSTRREGEPGELDPLASFLPSDQHALFFPSFSKLLEVMDQAMEHGTGLLDLAEARIEDARSRERYETQLCLPLNAATRLIGPQVVKSVVLTGSDSYLRTGTDVGVWLEAALPDAVEVYLESQRRNALRSHADCKPVEGEIGGLHYDGVVDSTRTISSYTVRRGSAFLVTNSLVQIERLAAVLAGHQPSMASLPEFSWFRTRYRRGDADEDAFLMLTDATIRRWCGPRWRIGASRRTRAASILSHLQARELDALVQEGSRTRTIATSLDSGDLGALSTGVGGVRSETYGSLAFLTPISELDLDHVSQNEANGYENWRRGYERAWTEFFDPIGIRLTLREGRWATDITVMPLVARSEYRDLIDLCGKASIAPLSGDRHAGALLNVAMAIDIESDQIEGLAGMFKANTGSLFHPLSWMEGSVSMFAEASPFWGELVAARNEMEFLEDNLQRFPLGLRAEVKNPLSLAAFLTGLRGLVDSVAPQLTAWETLEHNGQGYVRIRAANVTGIEMFYAAMPSALMLSPNETLLKAAIEREQVRLGGLPAADGVESPPPAMEPARPWTGSHLAVQVEKGFAEALEGLFGPQYHREMQHRSWGNLPILNEWRRLHPEHDALEFHSDWWNVRLRCPGGGEYAWNAELATYESTVYGCPDRPKDGPRVPSALTDLLTGDVGVEFEEDGLRARVEVRRGN